MSAALINRSLTNIRTELEFLHDSEVIDETLFNALLEALPQRYSKGMAPWGAEKLSAEKEGFVEEVSQSLQKSTIQDDIKEPANPARVPPRKPAGPIGYCKALYNYEAQEADDLALSKDDKLAVLEHLSLDWWKGYKLSQGPDQAGVFPSNYVSVILETEFQLTREKAPINEKATFENRAQSPSAPHTTRWCPSPRTHSIHKTVRLPCMVNTRAHKTDTARCSLPTADTRNILLPLPATTLNSRFSRCPRSSRFSRRASMERVTSMSRSLVVNWVMLPYSVPVPLSVRTL